MFSSLIIGICSIFQRKNNLYYKINTSIMSLLLIVMMPSDVFFNAAIWITGSFNYLWPSAIAFIGYSLLIKKINMENHEKTQSLICYLLFVICYFLFFIFFIIIQWTDSCSQCIIMHHTVNFLQNKQLQYKTIIKCDGDFTISYYLYCNLPRK